MMESLLFLNGQNLEFLYRIVVDMKHHFYYCYHYDYMISLLRN